MILDKIIQKTKERVENEKQVISYDKMKGMALSMPLKKDFPFYHNLKSSELSYILEVKKASPSKGLISKDFDYISIAKDYERLNAAGISVLCEPDFFLGSIDYLKEISKAVHTPLLRKDFIIDDYMIYQAKVYGASAILLICRILSLETLKSYIDLAHDLGLDVLVEAHNEDEIRMAIEAGARIIGVNNRDLSTFHVDIMHSIALRKIVPEDILFVSESGIETHDDIVRLHEHKIDAVLIGETVMKAKNKEQVMAMLRGDLC